MALDEPRYLQLADKAFRALSDLFEHVDPDEADAAHAGDVLTITFRNGVRAVLNTQRPTRQLWFAARARAWHFDYDEPTGTWRSDKNRDEELFATVRAVVRENAQLELPT